MGFSVQQNIVIQVGRHLHNPSTSNFHEISWSGHLGFRDWTVAPAEQARRDKQQQTEGEDGEGGEKVVMLLNKSLNI